MYLYGREGFGQIPTTLQPRNLTPGSSYAFGPAASALEGFGQAPPRWEQSPRELRESHPVVRAIRSLPEGRTCPTPEHAPEHERRIVEKLRQQGFREWDIEAGLNLVRRDIGLPARQWPKPIAIGPPQTTMREAEPGAKERGAIYEARLLEERFLKAERSGDVKGMAEAAEAYYRLLGQFPSQGPGEPMPGRGVMQRQREKELEARANIMRQAPNLASIVRTLGSWDLAVLRGKIGEYVRQRVVARQHRSRARR
jgi:hypothetical protein